MTDLIQRAKKTLSERVEAIQDPIPEFAMRHFVVGQHDTPGQQWAQAILELDNRLAAIAMADIDIQIGHKKIEALERRGTDVALLKADKVRIELSIAGRARLGTVRGVGHLLKIIVELESKHGGRGWTREELDAEQPEYWMRRGNRQMLQDLNAMGRVGVGNQEMQWQMGRPIDPPENHIAAVERRFLDVGSIRILVAVPTLMTQEHVRQNGLRCLEGWDLPTTIERKALTVTGRPVADAYNEAARRALEDGANFLLTVEDDHVIPPGTFEKLWRVYQQHGPRAIVGAWYPQKREPRTGAPICLRGSRREPLDDGGAVEAVYAMTQGFTLFPVDAFRQIPEPWFVTTGNLTQDSFFSQKAREAGWNLLIDTSARIKHVCRDTGRVYE